MRLRTAEALHFFYSFSASGLWQRRLDLSNAFSKSSSQYGVRDFSLLQIRNNDLLKFVPFLIAAAVGGVGVGYVIPAKKKHIIAFLVAVSQFVDQFRN